MRSSVIFALRERIALRMSVAQNVFAVAAWNVSFVFFALRRLIRLFCSFFILRKLLVATLAFSSLLPLVLAKEMGWICRNGNGRRNSVDREA